MRMRSIWPGLIIIGLGMITPPTVVAQNQNVTSDTVMATVGGVDITLGHMVAAWTMLPEPYSDVPDQFLFDNILDHLIRQQTLANIAERDLTPRMELTLENERRVAVAAMLLDTIAANALTEDALRAEYESIYANADGVEELNVSHILVETEAEAQALIDALNDGGDFAELAQEHSTGPSGPSGGQLGWFSAGTMVPAFEDAAFALDIGGVSAPVQTQFGWHVLMLNDRRMQDPPTFDAVRAELVEGVRTATVEAYITQATGDAEIVHPESDIDPAVIRDLRVLDE